ncbi:acyl-CoA dehydrogenase N-terminal domain-containing protein, partial [Burkholderia lata]|uniref:acyl-CoA dehydrogenase N-terminal domain-containing protein n=1 Tax=Burkholderia lata (strain ATCC 17760 / DSM 23089 / LMG 22485 / NCIMB 9086 / R18194 / 383) TaxID=482957 RepID=UPI001583CE51
MADFVTTWAGYDNKNRPPRHYDDPRRRQGLAGFPASRPVAPLIYRLIGTSTMSYNAPVKDMLFVLKELAGIDAVA